jgi:hypothetical protein
MHQRLQIPRHEAVVDEEVLFDAELRVAAFEIAGAIPRDPMAEGQVLGACWRPDGIGLNEAESVEGALERAGREERPGDRVPSQIVEGRQALRP